MGITLNSSILLTKPSIGATSEVRISPQVDSKRFTII